MTAKKKTEMAKATSTAMATSEVPDWMDLGDNSGSEEVGMSDITIPRIELVQALSPCRIKSEDAYIEGAEEGMLYNTVTNELYGETLQVIPVYFTKQWLVWVDRKKMQSPPQSFFGAYNSLEEANEAIESMDLGENENLRPMLEAIETAQNYCLTVVGGDVQQVLISMAKTKLKIARDWNSLIRRNMGARYSSVYTIGASYEKKPKGSYYNYSIANSGEAGKVARVGDREVYEKAAEMCNLLKSGALNFKSDYEEDEIKDAEAVADDSEI